MVSAEETLAEAMMSSLPLWLEGVAIAAGGTVGIFVIGVAEVSAGTGTGTGTGSGTGAGVGTEAEAGTGAGAAGTTLFFTVAVVAAVADFWGRAPSHLREERAAKGSIWG